VLGVCEVFHRELLERRTLVAVAVGELIQRAEQTVDPALAVQAL